MQWTLVGVQVALAVTLLVGAGLLLRSMQELGRVSPGFDPDHVLTLRVTANYGETVDMKALTQKVERMLDAIRAVPGVQAAATSSALSGVPQQFPTELKILEGALDPNRKIVADSRFVSAGYFATMRIPLLTGEDCRDGLEHGVLVNRSFADANFGASPAVGHHVETSALGTLPLAGMIRGVVADAREQGINSAPGPTVYWCMAAPMPDPYYLARTQGDPLALAETLRRAIHEVEPARSVFNVSTLNEHLSDAFGENRLRTLLLSLFALTAVSLACIGLYGTLSYLVTLRRREVGLRIALGAQRRQIVRRFLLQGLRVCAIGCACGLALAAASGRLLAGMLYGISPLDARTLSGVVALLLIVGACAALVPSVRAARTDPMEVLREG
jgi:predicted permease